MKDHNRKTLFKKLGYDVTLVGAEFFNDLVDDACQQLEVLDTEEDVKAFLPRCSVEYACFAYECGLVYFNNQVEQFVGSRTVNRDNKKINREVYGDIKGKSVEDSIIGVAKYLNAHKENSLEKTMVKKNNG